MKTSTLLTASLALLADARVSATPKKTPVFFLAGDSTTKGEGGWGSGFLPTLKSPAWGINFAVQGTTTRTFVNSGYWANLTSYVAKYSKDNDVYVTISFGHNDQKEGSGVNETQFKDNLVNLGTQIKKLNATPLFVTSLTRRVFPTGQPNNATDSLHNQRLLAIQAAKETASKVLDLNAASLNYVNQIGQTNANKFNFGENGTTGTDKTHLNPFGSVVFGRMVADLAERALPQLNKYFLDNSTLSNAIWSGKFPS